MGFLSRLKADQSRRYPSAGPRQQGGSTVSAGRMPPSEQPPGGFSFGTSWFGGPYYTDKFNSRRAPSPFKLVENYQALVYALVARKRDAVAKVPFRLYADGSRVQGGKPRSACDPIKVSRAVGMRLARDGQISSAAVDQVYEVRTHPLLDVLDRPDPYGYFDRRKLIGLLCAYQDVLGSAFLIPEGNGWDWTRPGDRKKGPPEILWVVYPQYVIPVRYGSTPLINYWQYFRDYLPFEGTIWFRQSISLRDAYGSSFSPTYAGDIYADQEGKFIAVYDQVLGIGARPNLIASAKDAMMPPGEIERKRLEQDMKRRHSGGNAGGVLVNNGAWDFTPMNYPPADLAGKELAEYDRNCLAAIFGIPPQYFSPETNLANSQAADEQMAKFAVDPMCHSICGTLTALARQWDPRLHVLHDEVVEEDEESKMKVVEMRLRNGLTTPNQENEEARWPAFPEGDEHWIDGSLKTMKMLTEAHEQGMQQGQQEMEQGQEQHQHDLQQGEQQMDIDRETADFELTAEEGDTAEVRALLARAQSLTRAIEQRMAS